MKGAGHTDSIVAERLLPLLRSKRSEEACAVAVVLGALRLRDPAVGRALAARLRRPDPIRPYVLDALARQRTEQALGCVLGGLVGTGVDREQSRRLMKAFGAQATKGLERALLENPEKAETLYATAAQLRTRAGVLWLMRRLRSAPPTQARLIYFALRREMNAWPRDLRTCLRRAAVRLIRPGARPSRSAALAALRLLRVLHDGAIAEPIRALSHEGAEDAVRAEAAAVLRAFGRRPQPA